MNSLPQNNLAEHLARFAATKKTKSYVSSNPTSGQFTFKKAASLDKAYKTNTNESALKPVENWVSKPKQNPTFNLPEIPSRVAPIFKAPAALKAGKKQQTITSLFSSNHRKEQSSQSQQRTCKSEVLADSLDCYLDDLNDFDLSTSRFGASNFDKNKSKADNKSNEWTSDEIQIVDLDNSTSNDKVGQSNLTSSKLSDSSVKEQESTESYQTKRNLHYTKCEDSVIAEDKSIILDSTIPECDSTSKIDVPKQDDSQIDSLPDFVETQTLLGSPNKGLDDCNLSDNEEVVRSVKKKRIRNKPVIFSDDDEEIGLTNEEITINLSEDRTQTPIKEHVLPNKCTSPKTALLNYTDDDDFCTADVYLGRSSIDSSVSSDSSKYKFLKPKSSQSSRGFNTTSSHSKNHFKVSNKEAGESWMDPPSKYFENSSLLQKSHFKDEKIEMLQSILASLDEMNVSVMEKICSEVEKDKNLTGKNNVLGSLVRVRKKILSQSSAAKKAIASRSKCSGNPSPSQNTEAVSIQNDFKSLKHDPSLQLMQSTPFVPVASSSKFVEEKNCFLGNSYSEESKRLPQSPPTPPEEEYYAEKNEPLSGSSKYEHDRSATVTPDPLDIPDLDFCCDDDDEVFSQIGCESYDVPKSGDVTIARDIYGKKSPEKIKNSSLEKGVAGKFYGNYRDDGASQQFKGKDFPHSKEMLRVFRDIFGLREFRYNQLEAINAALLNEDCFILMPTGGGKSLCYQLPALVMDGVTIVVSPLRSLIMDQVQKLWSLDAPANSLSGEMDSGSANAVYRQLASREPGIKLLYVTPEKISASNKLMSTLQSLYSRKMLSRFVIDEAHCVSEWGHDFRPDYKKLKVLREKFPGVPMIALTATATPRVRVDILQQLNMSSPKWFLQSFNRPNLKYEVRAKRGKACFQDIYELLTTHFKNMSGIVYCLSRNDCDSCAKFLKEKGVKAISYHAGLENRNEVQESWFNDQYKVVCATIAFGMGIDKPDVRFVIHHTIPKSIECYYQESGRAGRDGELSWCILFYSYQDMHRIKKLIQMDTANRKTWGTHFNNLFRIVHFCENKTDCRRVQMLEYFGEVFDRTLCSQNPKAACDNCFSKEVFENCDVTEDAKAIVQCVFDLTKKQKGKKNYTLTYFTDIFKGSKTQKILSAGHDKLPLHGRGSKYSRSDAERLHRKLVLDQFLQENLVVNQMDLMNSYVFCGRRANDLLEGKVRVIFPMKKDKKNYNNLQVASEVEDNEMKDLTERCYNELIEVSKAIAAEHNMHYTNIINVEALRQMSREMPVTQEAMLQIPHVTRTIFDKYGPRFLEVTERYGAERCILEAERSEKCMMDVFLDDTDNTNWSEHPAPARTYNRKSGVKRKRGNVGAPGKKIGKFSGAKKFAWKGKAKKKNKPTVKSPGYHVVAPPQSSGRAPGFLPVPKPQTKSEKQFSRPFLSNAF